MIPDGESKTYRYVSMIPSNWYQWLDPNQPEDDSWINVSMLLYLCTYMCVCVCVCA